MRRFWKARGDPSSSLCLPSRMIHDIGILLSSITLRSMHDAFRTGKWHIGDRPSSSRVTLSDCCTAHLNLNRDGRRNGLPNWRMNFRLHGQRGRHLLADHNSLKFLRICIYFNVQLPTVSAGLDTECLSNEIQYLHGVSNKMELGFLALSGIVGGLVPAWRRRVSTTRRRHIKFQYDLMVEATRPAIAKRGENY